MEPKCRFLQKMVYLKELYGRRSNQGVASVNLLEQYLGVISIAIESVRKKSPLLWAVHVLHIPGYVLRDTSDGRGCQAIAPDKA